MKSHLIAKKLSSTFRKSAKNLRCAFVLCGMMVVPGLLQVSHGQQPAFPGAGGGGGDSKGGRGGQVIYVTNLNDSGSGSLRSAVNANGPRTVVFRVGGTINLQSPLEFRNPYITVAGQTAPGGGILLKGNYLSLHWGVHDVIIRYIKIRLGRGAGFSGQAGDCISIGDGAHNIIVDQCSLSWSQDETVGLWSDTNPIYDITFSRNLIAEALNYDHAGSGFITGSNVDSDDIVGITVYRNVFMHNFNRNPLLKCGQGQIVNNIIYNSDKYNTQFAGGMQIDIISNLYKNGPNSDNRSEVLYRPHDGTPNTGPAGNPSIHFKGNIGPHNSNPNNTNQWNTMLEQTAVAHWGYPGSPPKLKRVNRAFERSNPMTVGIPLAVANANNLENLLLSSVGAQRRMRENGTWTGNRDAVDLRLIQEYQNGTGTNPQDENDVGGFPTIASGTPYKDSDKDGMGNSWEIAHGFNPNNANDRNGDADSDGYTNLEEFLNGTSPGNGSGGSSSGGSSSGGSFADKYMKGFKQERSWSRRN